jgi:hypothetical protein
MALMGINKEVSEPFKRGYTSVPLVSAGLLDLAFFHATNEVRDGGKHLGYLMSVNKKKPTFIPGYQISVNKKHIYTSDISNLLTENTFIPGYMILYKWL